MGRITVKIKHTGKTTVPTYAHSGDSGLDIRADVSKTIADLISAGTTHSSRFTIDPVKNEIQLYPGNVLLIKTGVRVEIPKGYEIQVRSKSGLALNHGVMCLNSPGTVDSNYRGDIGVIIYNAGYDNFIIKQDMKIAQLVLCKVEELEWKHVDDIEDSNRGEGGFGSTGLK